MNATAAVVDIRRPYTLDDFRREREELIAAHGKNKKEAVAKHDQAFAMFFHRTVYRHGWTQEQVAKAEGKSRIWVTVRLRFGSFLNFVTTVTISEKVASKLAELTEWSFRRYWEATDKTETNDRIRFAEVIEELSNSRKRQGLSKKILDAFDDGKWHDIEVIATRVGESAESLKPMLANFAATNPSYSVGLCEHRQKGKTVQYRMLRASERRVDLDVLKEELGPILDGLKVEGKKNVATISPGIVLGLAHQLEKLIEKLAK